MAGPRTTVLRFVTGLAAVALAGVLHVPGARGDDAPLRDAPTPVPSAANATANVTDDDAWVVVVHPSNPARTMNRSDLERIWRRTTAFWPEGQAVVPLNLPGGDPLRHTFQAAVLRAGDEALAQWWNRAYFQGVSPPVVLKTGAAVKAYVAVTPSAIGYIPASEADASVAVVEVDLDR
jgi:hypothetical protein